MGNDRHQPLPLPDAGDEQRTGRARFSGPARPGSGRVLLIAVAVCLCAAVAGVSFAAFSGPAGSAGGHPGHTGGTANNPAAASGPAMPPAASAAAGRSTNGAQVTSQGIAKTALQWPPQLTQQIAAWKAGSGGTASSAVTTELGTAMQAAGVGLYVQMKQACRSLGTSVKTAQGAPPIPDGAMQQEYDKALAGLSSAAVDCQNAISAHPDGDEVVDTKVNKSLLNQALTRLATGSRELYTATAEIRALRR